MPIDVTRQEASPGNESTLRDRLAVDRTLLANERTLLAYVRTGLAFGVVGGSLIKFFQSPTLCFTGWSLVVVGVLIIAAGSSKFLAVHHRLKSLDQHRITASAGNHTEIPGQS